MTKESIDVEKRAGGFRRVLIIAILTAVAVSSFYFLIWRVPDRTEPAEREFNRNVVRMSRNNEIPQGKNGWFNYERAIMISYRTWLKQSGRDSMIKLRLGVNKGDREYVEELKKKNSKAYEEIRNGFAKDVIVAPVKLQDGLKAKFPNFLQMSILICDLGVIGEMARLDGNYREAAENFLAGIRFGANVGHNSSMLTAVLGLKMIEDDLKPLEKMLQKDSPDLETCRYITRQMTRINGEAVTLQEILGNEFVLLEYSLANGDLDGATRAFDSPFSGPGSGLSFEKLIISLPKEQVIVREKKIYENWYLDRLELISHDYGKNAGGFPEYGFPRCSLFKTSRNPNLDQVYGSYLLTMARMRGVEILAALEWYNRDKGKYPDSLEKLVPDYLPEIPKDPYAPDGKFRYVTQGDGVFLYSIGHDLKDSGGKVEVGENIGSSGDVIFINPEMIMKRKKK